MRQEENTFIKINSSPISEEKVAKARRFREEVKWMQKQAEIKFISDKALLMRDLKKVELPNIKANLLDQKRELISKYLNKNKFKCIPSNPEQLIPKAKPKKPSRSISLSSLPKISSSKSLPKS